MKVQDSHVVGSMFLTWLVGLLFGFYYGLNREWYSLILYIYLMIIFIVIFISTTIIKNSKEQGDKK